MNTNKIFAIGVMSGTSLDGVDLVYVKFLKNNYKDFEILHAETIPYSKEWLFLLQGAINFSSEKLNVLDVTYGELLAGFIKDFIKKHQIKNINFIASHGHTVLHQPEKGITLQIGDGQTLASLTRQKVICDFRTQDVALGGQGAPLVPIGDELLFSEFDFCLNLGGFSNISYHKNGRRIAYDICAVNIVLNVYAQQLGFSYDDKGAIAASGNLIEPLEVDLKKLSFYQEKAPKSLGLEWVQKEIYPKLDSFKNTPASILRTYTDHVAWAIARELPEDATVLVTGGGAFNDYLMGKMKAHKKLHLVHDDKDLINYKEALIFAFLGLLRVDNQVNCLKSVTGAQRDHSSGVVFYP